MSAVRAMQEWCRLQCEGYSGVQIRDLSSSFRDGLAFCALIHKHRPDLIDFDSLSKENVYENNRLAFEVAEQELGIPALLDPTDMVSMRVPDRLSIMTYLSQYYNYFRNPPPVLLHPQAVKRSAAASSSEPALKKIVEKASTPPREEEELEPATRTSLSSTCASCHRHVHLVQRYLVEGRLYHRQCFRCKDCCGTLLPGSYMPGPENGTFVCTHHRGRGSTMPPNVLVSHQDDSATSGEQDSGDERGKEGQEDCVATPKEVSGSMPVPPGASMDCKSDVNEAPSLAATALSANAWVKLKEQDDNALEVEHSTPTDVSDVPHLTQNVNETGLAKPRPQIPSKPALPIKPAALQEHSATISSKIDSGGSSLPMKLQHHNGVSQSTDCSDPCIPISFQNQSGTSHLSNDSAEVTLPVSPQNLTVGASLSSDNTEIPALTTPENSVCASSCGKYDVELPQVLEAHCRSGDQDNRPIPAARRPVGTVATPQTIPVPKPRSTQPGDAATESMPSASTQVTNGVQPESDPPVPKPRSRPMSSERVENGKPHKEPPWIVLVQEKRRKSAPLPPGTPPRALTEEQLQSPAQDRVGRTSLRKPPLQPKPYNPFDDDEDDDPEASDSSLNQSHPWYGITPTSSPKQKKRAAPKAPNASPLARHTSLHPASRISHSEPSSCTPSPALSIESLSSDPSLNETVSKSSSEPAVHAAALCPTNGDPTPARLSAGELAHRPADLATSPQSSRSSSCGSLKSSPHRPPPPKPTVPSAAASSQEGSESVTSPPPKTQPKSSCKENPFNRKASPAASPVISPSRKSTKGPKPARPPAPGHGFPLVKRKVQADQYIPEEDIHGELNTIERQLDEMERRGIELESKLRSLDSETEDDDELLVDWFRLIHEKHMLVRRESELVYVIKQQNLEQRQADVEYELRCLLNKPEKDWTVDDKAREEVLMAELVTIIEQRNAIVTCLDEDRQREEEEDKLLAAMIKKKDFHKDSESTMTKKKGKFKPLKALKMLSSKPDPKPKSPKDKS
ncbi:MICAL-like protein 1 isoform X2 [Lissotriton helveticus]